MHFSYPIYVLYLHYIIKCNIANNVSIINLIIKLIYYEKDNMLKKNICFLILRYTTVSWLLLMNWSTPQKKTQTNCKTQDWIKKLLDVYEQNDARDKQLFLSIKCVFISVLNCQLWFTYCVQVWIFLCNIFLWHLCM